MILAPDLGELGEALPIAEDQLIDCIVPIRAIEEASGLDFFNALPEQLEADLEGIDGRLAWSLTIGTE
jgi:hypothetical protein